MRRASFIAAAGAWAAGATAASATGGRDIDATESAHEMRVLLASDPVRAPQPELIDAYSFRFNGRDYRGRYESARLIDGRMGLINVVPLDAYLYGVVSKELSARWPRAALEAQAIVARTYALTKQKPGKPYDVVASESDQAYGGIGTETVEARDAVDATGGTIVTYASAPARLAFSSCCGGHTANAGNMWGTDFAYLRGVVDPHCSNAPEFHWQREVSYDEFCRAFGATIAPAGAVQRVDLRELDDTGRARFVGIAGDRGDVQIKMTAFRTALGTEICRSTLVANVQVEGGPNGMVSLVGTGRGHGVGLCQWGAHDMALGGADADAIVQFYFPQTALGRA